MTGSTHGRHHKHRAEVASHIPGRIRLRLHRPHRHPHTLQSIKTSLERREGIHKVEANHITGSLLIHYDTQVHSETGILGLLKDIDVVVGTIVDAPHIEGGSETGGSNASLSFATALNDLARRFASLTGFTLDLRTLFPLSLASVGVWLIIENGLMLEMMPGWLFLWLAFDSFLKLQPHALTLSAPASPSGAGESATE
jgi:hypothetical protein